jgi:hypothetical protein
MWCVRFEACSLCDVWFDVCSLMGGVRGSVVCAVQLSYVVCVCSSCAVYVNAHNQTTQRTHANGTQHTSHDDVNCVGAVLGDVFVCGECDTSVQNICVQCVQVVSELFSAHYM